VAEAGLKFFGEFQKSGNFLQSIGTSSTVANRTTPIVIRWDNLALLDRDTLRGNPSVQVIIPETGIVAGVSVMAISKYARHPNAAKLWMEYVFSDEGQLLWLRGYCHPIRFRNLAFNNKIPADMITAMPPQAAYANVVFLPIDKTDHFFP
jgi:putative spermidine/putrescine transport system substrate-binding protein